MSAGSTRGVRAAGNGEGATIPSFASIARSRPSIALNWPPCAIDLKKAMIAITGSASTNSPSSTNSIGIAPAYFRTMYPTANAKRSAARHCGDAANMELRHAE